MERGSMLTAFEHRSVGHSYGSVAENNARAKYRAVPGVDPLELGRNSALELELLYFASDLSSFEILQTAINIIIVYCCLHQAIKI